jgi:hypothetical protein
MCNIRRFTTTPTFFRYIVDHPLVPTLAPVDPGVETALISNFEWTVVPSFQRGVEWDVEDIEKFVEGGSALLGTAILGVFPADPGQWPYLQPPHLRRAPDSVSVLVDGLQRLSVGTCLLSVLHTEVLCAAPASPQHAGHFARMSHRCVPDAVLYLHNDQMLASHERAAVSEPYRNLRERVQTYVKERLTSDAARFANEMERLFLHRQISVDSYTGFASQTQLAQCFIGINTVRVDLDDLDLLRSMVVDRAFRANWSPADVQDAENEFTDTFTDDGTKQPDKDLEPFIAIVLDLLEGKSPGANPQLVFPSWPQVLDIQEVRRFLAFIDNMVVAADTNLYLREILQVGTIPFAGVIGYYYHRQQTQVNAGQPSFFTGGALEDAELHQFLCANLRALLAGKIGRTRDIAEDLMKGLCPSLTDAAERISQRYLGCSINTPVDVNWLTNALLLTKKNRAPRVFNAMRLPQRGTWGAPYIPDRFGRSALDFHVDHLIPKATFTSRDRGAHEGELLVNFAPLPGADNKEAKASRCSAKLDTNGLYDRYIHSATSPHPYCQFLVTQTLPHLANTQRGLAHLDRIDLLIPSGPTGIPEHRLAWMVNQLLPRI